MYAVVFASLVTYKKETETERQRATRNQKKVKEPTREEAAAHIAGHDRDVELHVTAWYYSVAPTANQTRMLCGLYALNALLDAARRQTTAAASDGDDDAFQTLFTREELDLLTEEVHRAERALCPEAVDTAPDAAGGNYPLEVLLRALQRRGLCAAFLPAVTRGAHEAEEGAAAVGYLIGTGRHYMALVRSGDLLPDWVLMDDGVAKTPPPGLITADEEAVPGDNDVPLRWDTRRLRSAYPSLVILCVTRRPAASPVIGPPAAAQGAEAGGTERPRNQAAAPGPMRRRHPALSPPLPPLPSSPSPYHHHRHHRRQP